MDIANQIQSLIGRFEAVIETLNKVSTAKGLAKWMIDDIVSGINMIQKGLALLKLTQMIATPNLLYGDNLEKFEEVIPRYAQKIVEYEKEAAQLAAFAELAKVIDFSNEPKPEETGFDKFKRALSS